MPIDNDIDSGGGGGGAPSGPAGGDLGGTYPNPSVDDDGHAHTAATLPATIVYDGDAAAGELAGTYPNPTVAASHSGSTHAAVQAAAEATAAADATTKANAAAAASVAKTLYDAQSTVIAVSDNAPVVLSIPSSTFVGRKASGDVTAMTTAEAEALLTGLVPKSLYDAQSILVAVSDNTPTALTVGASTFVGRKATGDVTAMTATEAAALLTALVPKSLYDANTILAATTDDTPAALTVAASRIVGRKATGDIAALTGAEVEALLPGTTLSTLPGYVSCVAVNNGTAFSNTVTEQTYWNGTLYSIPANTVVVGDVFEITANGLYLNNSGAGSELFLETFFGSRSLGQMITQVVNTVKNDANARYWTYRCRARCTTAGSSGIFETTNWFFLGQATASIGTLSNVNGAAGTVGAVFENTYGITTGTVDLTAAVAISPQAKMNTATSTQTVTGKGIQIVKYNAP